MHDGLIEHVFAHLYARYLVTYALHESVEYLRWQMVLGAELLLQQKAVRIDDLPSLRPETVRAELNGLLLPAMLHRAQEALFDWVVACPVEVAEPLFELLLLTDVAEGWFDDGWLRRFSPAQSRVAPSKLAKGESDVN